MVELPSKRSSSELESVIQSVLKKDVSGRTVYQAAQECAFPEGGVPSAKRQNSTKDLSKLYQVMRDNIDDTRSPATVYRTAFTLIYERDPPDKTCTSSPLDDTSTPDWMDAVVDKTFPRNTTLDTSDHVDELTICSSSGASRDTEERGDVNNKGNNRVWTAVNSSAIDSPVSYQVRDSTGYARLDWLVAAAAEIEVDNIVFGKSV